MYKTLYIKLKIEPQTIQRKRQTLMYKTLYIKLKIEPQTIQRKSKH